MKITAKFCWHLHRSPSPPHLLNKIFYLRTRLHKNCFLNFNSVFGNFPLVTKPTKEENFQCLKYKFSPFVPQTLSNHDEWDKDVKINKIGGLEL